MTGENILWKGRKTRKVFIHYYVVAFLLIVLGAISFAEIFWKVPFSMHVSITLIAIGLIVIVVQEIKRIGVRYIITETRVIKEMGIVNKKTEYIPYQMVERISFESPWYMRILKIGDIRVDTGEDSFLLESLNHPEKIEALLNRAMERVIRYRQGGRNV